MSNMDLLTLIVEACTQYNEAARAKEAVERSLREAECELSRVREGILKMKAEVVEKMGIVERRLDEIPSGGAKEILEGWLMVWKMENILKDTVSFV